MRGFIAGLSKSGKTSRSTYAAAHLDRIQYISVSQLLRARGCKFPVATVEKGLGNQRQAAKALLSLPVLSEHQIIDGHAMIETLEGPLLVPDSFFIEISIDYIIFIHDRPVNILARRGMSISLESMNQIKQLNSIELAACKRLSQLLQIDLNIFLNPTQQEFSATVQKCISKI